MRLKIMFSMVLLFLTSASMFAVGFPVTRAETNVTIATISINEDSATTNTITSPAATAGKEMSTALLLWFFLGLFAAHRWYLGSPIGWNILYIITFGGLGIWAIIDLIDIITEKYPGL